MRKLLIILSLCLLCSAATFGEARQNTFENKLVQLSGEGSHYQLNAQMQAKQETRFRLNCADEELNLILTHGKIYDQHWQEQKVVNLFAKLVNLGLLDPFFIIEILDGSRDEFYSPYMRQISDNHIQLKLNPQESITLYEQWISDLRGLFGAAADDMSDLELSIAEGVLRQILSALEASVQYDFYIKDDKINQIEIQSEVAAPEARKTQTTITVSQALLPSS